MHLIRLNQWPIPFLNLNIGCQIRGSPPCWYSSTVVGRTIAQRRWYVGTAIRVASRFHPTFPRHNQTRAPKAIIITRNSASTLRVSLVMAPEIVSLCARQIDTGETKRVWPKTTHRREAIGASLMSLLARLQRPTAREQNSQSVAILGVSTKKAAVVNLGLVVYPRATLARTNGLQVAGAGFEPTTSRL